MKKFIMPIVMTAILNATETHNNYQNSNDLFMIEHVQTFKANFGRDPFLIGINDQNAQSTLKRIQTALDLHYYENVINFNRGKISKKDHSEFIAEYQNIHQILNKAKNDCQKNTVKDLMESIKIFWEHFLIIYVS
jgi:vacuolar-type H+-ATPase subunit C/Vma6